MNANDIIAKTYYDFAVTENVNMLKVAELLENFRKQVKDDHPFAIWENIKIDLTSHENLVPGFISLFRQYLAAFYKEKTEKLAKTFKKSKEEGVSEWLRAYTDGVIYYRSEFKIPLCQTDFSFPKSFIPELEEYRKMNRWIQESRWIDAHPVLEKLAAKNELTPSQKSSLQLLLGLIELYYFTNWQQSDDRIQKARELDPANPRNDRTLVEYMLRDNKITEAKNALLTIITKNPDQYIHYNLLANCYKEEGNLAAAEQWYYDAMRVHSLQTESLSALVRLYSDKKWYSEKKEKIGPVIQKIKELEVFPDYDTELYNAWRDYADGMSVNEEPGNVPGIYEKAIEIKPGLVTAIIDYANFCIRSGENDKAEKLLKKAEKTDPECFDVYWGLSYLYEKTDDKIPAALAAYQKCLALRPAWADQVYNFMANLYARQQDFTRAILYYDQAIRFNPGNTVYRENLGNLAEKIINNANAVADPSSTDELVDKIAALVSDKDVMNRIGNYYYRNGSFEKALAFYERAITLDPLVSVYYENKGLALENLKQYDEAEKNYLKACDLEHTSGEPFNTLGYFYFLQNKFKQASDYYRKALEKDSKNETYLQNLVRSYGDAGHFELAEQWNRELVKLNPDNSTHIAQLAFYLSAQNKNEEALETIREAYRKTPEDNYVLKTLGTIYEKTNQGDKAFELYKKLVQQTPDDDNILNRLGVFYYRQKNYKEAIGYYKKAIAINSKAGVYYDNLGLAFEFSGDLSGAEECYRQYALLEPRNGDAYNNLAVVLFKQKKYQEAEKNYLSALECQPDHPTYLENIAILYRALQDNKKAIEFFEKAIKVKPENHINHNDVGVLYYVMGDQETAVRHYLEAIRLLPDSSLYYENLGLAYKEMNRRPDERQAYETALSLDPDSARLMNRLGVWFFEEKDNATAINFYHQALSLDANNPTYLENLALALYSDDDESNDEEAIEVYRRLLKATPDNFNAWNELGILLYRKQQYREAIDAYASAGQIKPGSAVIYENIGLAYLSMEKYSEAAAFYQQALDAGSENRLKLLQDIGDMYHLKMNKSDLAIPYYKEALHIKPDMFTWKYLAEAYEAVSDFNNAKKAKEEAAKLQALESQ